MLGWEVESHCYLQLAPDQLCGVMLLCDYSNRLLISGHQ